MPERNESWLWGITRTFSILKRKLRISKSSAAYLPMSWRKERKMLGQHFIGGEKNNMPAKSGCQFQSPPMGAVGGIHQGHPVKCVGEKCRHSSLLGQP